MVEQVYPILGGKEVELQIIQTLEQSKVTEIPDFASGARCPKVPLQTAAF